MWPPASSPGRAPAWSPSGAMSSRPTTPSTGLSRRPATRGVSYLLADLSSQEDVRRLARDVNEQLPSLDVLLNNAGAIFLSNRRSVDGLEMTFALNHMSYFLLTLLTLDLMRDSAPARIINVSSSSHSSPGKFVLDDLPMPGSNRGYRAYGRSKLCNILFTYELARRLEGTGVTVNALHPGLVRTNIARNNGLLGTGRELLHRRPGESLRNRAPTPSYTSPRLPKSKA